MTDLTPRLVRLGDALERAARSDLRPKRSAPAAGPRSPPSPR